MDFFIVFFFFEIQKLNLKKKFQTFKKNFNASFFDFSFRSKVTYKISVKKEDFFVFYS